HTVEAIRVFKLIALGFTFFLVSYVILMVRFVYYLSIIDIFKWYEEAVVQQELWAKTMLGPLEYYNIELMMSSGALFVILYVAASVLVIFIAVRRRVPLAIFLGLSFLVFSAGGFVSPKYERGGYHFIPIVIAIVAYVVSILFRWQVNRLA